MTEKRISFFDTVEGASPEAIRLIDILSQVSNPDPELHIPALIDVGLTHSEIATMAMADSPEEVASWAVGEPLDRKQRRYLEGASYNVLLLLREYGETDPVVEHMRRPTVELEGETLIDLTRSDLRQATRSVSNFAITRFNQEA